MLVQSQSRGEILLTLGKMVVGLGSAGQSIHREVYKAVRPMMTDRVMAPRMAAAKVPTHAGMSGSDFACIAQAV